MALKIRLLRRGRKKLALYDIVVADAKAPRDGRFVEKLGSYNPNTQPATTVLAEENAFQWLLKGAQPTNTVKNILSAQGVLLRKHLQIGVNKGAITQEAADKKFEVWKQAKESKLAEKPDQPVQGSQVNLTPKGQKVASVAKKEALPQPEQVPQVTATPEIDAQPDLQQENTPALADKNEQ